MSLILMAGVITGCSGEPGKKETMELLDRIYGGERFELDGNLVRSRDRDIEFYYIVPPDATVREYLKNSRNMYLNKAYGGTRSTFPIGNMWTSYKLLRNINFI